MLEDLEQAARSVFAAVSPLIVQIGREGRGSGIVVGPGLVLTNAHNLRDRTTTVTAPAGGATQAVATGVDIDGDLAVLRVEGAADGWPDPAGPTWREEPVEVGTPIFALSGGPGGPRLSFGLVSAVGRAFRGPRGRRISGSLEHTAPLPRGASGGPVVDAAGRLVGIDTHRLDHGAYLAVPAGPELRQRIDALRTGDAPARRRLGVALAPPHVARNLRRSVGLPERDGLLVRGVVPEGPAARAGLREGDLLVGAGGRPLVTVDDLHDALDGALDGGAAGGATSGRGELRLAVARGVEELEVVVTFDPAPAEGTEPPEAG